MLTYKKKGCVGCHSEMGCIGTACKYDQIVCYSCDDCDDELEPSELRYKDGDILCFNCFAQRVWDEAETI